MKKKYLLYLLIGLAGCFPDPPEGLFKDMKGIFPDHFPRVALRPDQELTPQRIALGKQLFFDPVLSRDSTVSCGSCHNQSRAFADGLKTAVGIENQTGPRNAPALHNLAWHPSFFWDGGVPNLELQVLAPIENPLEMDANLGEIIQKLNQNPEYVNKFRDAYGRDPDAYSLTRAIAAFERSLVSAQSPYDAWVTGQNPNALSASAVRGKEIFFGEKAECFHCHAGILFSDFSFQNNGLYEQYLDQGRYLINSKPSDQGKFKTPSLRNIALTAPYMHDGSIPTLEEVVRHYESGGKSHPNKSVLVRPFTLTEQERSDLIAFLHSLTDTTFVTNPAFQPE